MTVWINEWPYTFSNVILFSTRMFSGHQSGLVFSHVSGSTGHSMGFIDPQTNIYWGAREPMGPKKFPPCTGGLHPVTFWKFKWFLTAILNIWEATVVKNIVGQPRVLGGRKESHPGTWCTVCLSLAFLEPYGCMFVLSWMFICEIKNWCDGGVVIILF